jgi:NAD(P)-dependent dehydrogenase (short-subunit alcohol dehydrogenase family)
MYAEGAQVTGFDLHLPEDVSFQCTKVDVSDEDEVEVGVADVISQFGRIDVLVNSAGIWTKGTLLETMLDEWERLFAVNVRGTFLVSRAVLRDMQSHSSGNIINIASNYGLVGARSQAAYSATKGAIVALSRSMALDHAPFGIRVNCICPSTVNTPMIRTPQFTKTPDQIEAEEASRKVRHPIGRIANVEEIPPAVIFLASDDASFITGSILTIDGGYTAQ